MEPTKRCPYCGEEILASTVKCKHCQEWLNNGKNAEKGKPVNTETEEEQDSGVGGILRSLAGIVTAVLAIFVEDDD